MSRVIMILFAVALAGLLWLRHENNKLNRSLEKLNGIVVEQKRTIGMLENQLSVAADRADKNERAQVKLREKLSAASKMEARREKIITRLLNENEVFRRWYSADLPDSVRRLHQRTGCASAGDCLQRLPEGHALPDASQSARH
ncbi:phage lysis regulatory protein%2C LysB family [Serratia marcescens]|uniref:Rz-like lysis system protein LysB n=1 Tax=Serratia TaxID=613 RepID=UPI000745173B|nr:MULTISPECIES: Rz-like lysis system protein LysB [Serratia]MBJ2066953.1 LysB family phage lysis regulatory protein [Serratia odorifera]CVC02991.1 phage lysis regulatory protein%2C LysB family [Serratia marcescens]CVH14731.1 phage lysis regulatory protein%2C LysB family [Serratia marcescens]